MREYLVVNFRQLQSLLCNLLNKVGVKLSLHITATMGLKKPGS